MQNFGGVFAVANLRGGGWVNRHTLILSLSLFHTLPSLLHREYGDSWHKQGIFDKKQNVFDDFIAAAKYLIESKYTNPRK